ncbi:hypothetical protein F1631_12940 [Leptospira interrogans serovar Yeoncheon]|nr:hypothetical protein [Leptospira interrogans serovar Yeoncheon]
MSFPTRPIGKRCVEFSNAIHRKRCAEFPTRFIKSVVLSFPTSSVVFELDSIENVLADILLQH